MSTLAVCVCTYRRPAQLCRLLDALRDIQRPPQTIFVIVDNDGGDKTVERAVDNFRDATAARVEYVIERQGGISTARNRAVGIARAAGATMIAMIDDDEWPSADWLSALLHTREKTGAQVVGGPVLAVFPAVSGPPERYRRLWNSGPDSIKGRTYVGAAGNCLIDVAVIDSETPFDRRFDFTGGEDSVFFRRLFFAGATMAFSDSAHVFEAIPPDRATLAWMRRRWFRQGNVGVACENAVRSPDGPSPVLKTILLAARLLVYPLVNPRCAAAPMLWLFEAERICGRAVRHFGIEHAAYARPPARSANRR